ncbi:MAG: ADP-glyceromanno-heptose 6-epimerase [Salibacteraceae bacterium]
MIVITGAAGFIGSCVAKYVHSTFEDECVVLVDDFSREDKKENLNGLEKCTFVERGQFGQWSRENHPRAIIHLGARTDTTSTNRKVFDELNLEFSKRVWQTAARDQSILIYASSAATYGDGSHGYSDDHSIIPRLKPLNAYAESKQAFDLWALEQSDTPSGWYGLKFFNVYGPNEYHKGRMASVVYHAYKQISATGKLKLFRSHRPDYADGMQLRDFIYVKDVCSVIAFLMQSLPTSGIYNVGTGKARTFIDLATAVFEALNRSIEIEFIPIPEDIRYNYQYFTEADMKKLRKAGYTHGFNSLEEGISDYVTNYLVQGNYY